MSNVRLRSSAPSPLALGLIAAAASAALILYKSRKAEAENPPRGQFIEVDGVRLHYIERGIGTPLVLLHGNGSYSVDFEVSGLVDLAAHRYRVIAFDRPGFGYSERPRWRVWTPRAQAQLLHRAVQQLGVAKPVVLGHSWGTLVALAYGGMFPAEVSSLVLASGYYYPTLRLDVPLASPPAIPVIGDVLRYTVSPWLGRLMWPRLLKRVFGPGPIPAQARRLPRWMALRPWQLRASAADTALLIPGAAALMKSYSRLEVPVHIIAGGSDQYVSTAWQSARLHRAVPGSSYRETPGVGHMIHHLAPEEVLRVIDAAAGVRHASEGRTGAMDDARKAVETLPTGGDQYKRLVD